MRWLIIPLLALAACAGRGAGPDEATVQARMEQAGPAAGRGEQASWTYHAITRGGVHDATAAEAQAGNIPQGTTVWPVRVSAARRVGDRATEVQREFLFYQAGEDRHWVGVPAANGTTDRYR